jgi:geranylgeranyl diphosphate synthase type I
MLNAYRKKIDQSLAAFLTKVKKDFSLGLVSPVLYEAIREFSLREGKRIRPLLWVLSYKGYCPAGKKIPRSLYNASTCIEFLHNFMLIHDDIIDCADLRRGKPTMHRMLRNTIPCPDPDKLGTDLAIIAGDLVYALAIDAFLSIEEDPARKERALKYFVRTAAITALGEFIDTVHGLDTLEHIREKDVFLNYSLKTARYTFDGPLVTGAILAGAEASEIRRLSRLGLLIGQAFQIQDDVIGVFETEKRIGKSILSDLEEKKKTLLIVHAYRTLKGRKRKEFLRLFNKPRKNLYDLSDIKRMLVDSGSLAYALRAIHERTAQAGLIFKKLKMNDTYRLLLKESIEKLFSQSSQVASQNSLSEGQGILFP